MNREEYIARYCEAAYEKMLEQVRVWNRAHREETKARVKEWQEDHSDQVIAIRHEYDRKGGKYYEHKLKYNRTGIPGERNAIRKKHARQYRPYKDIIALDSQIHHEWIPNTSEYRGVALVEADQHMHGFVDVIEILDGEITLLTEEEVRRGKKR